MKVILNTITLLFIVSLWSCSKESIEVSNSVTSVVIQNTSTYEMDLGISGDEESAEIKTQALHMERSELIRDASTDWHIVYQYVPLANYVGSDSVSIETCTGGGASGCTTIGSVKIYFTITN